MRSDTVSPVWVSAAFLAGWLSMAWMTAQWHEAELARADAETGECLRAASQCVHDLASEEWRRVVAEDAVIEWVEVADHATHMLRAAVAELHQRPVLSVEDCALLAAARVAVREGVTMGRGRWAIVLDGGAVAETCGEAMDLMAASWQESSWVRDQVGAAGECGVTQVRACDTEGTLEGIACCDDYRHGGHHCRPTCTWLQEPVNAFWWTARYNRDRGGWDPGAYSGGGVGSGYYHRANGWRALARGEP